MRKRKKLYKKFNKGGKIKSQLQRTKPTPIKPKRIPLKKSKFDISKISDKESRAILKK